WRTLRELTAGGGGERDWLALPETEARYLRVGLQHGSSWRYGLRDIAIKPLAVAATPNEFGESGGAGRPRGGVARGVRGDQ
uniref:hypothetical protein n=1 Tax=Stenotrophomonas sp. SrG TaxID=3414430 RepID=UPI003CE97EEC